MGVFAMTDLSPDDPGAIDLEPYKTRRHAPHKLIAAVEALRERYDTLQTVDKFLATTTEKSLIRAEAAEARVAELEGIVVELETKIDAFEDATP